MSGEVASGKWQVGESLVPGVCMTMTTGWDDIMERRECQLWEGDACFVIYLCVCVGGGGLERIF